MVKVKSYYYGEIDVEERSVIRFPYGIPGFEDQKLFALLPVNDINYFYLLQSVEDENICFTAADPEYFFQGYQPDISPQDIEAVQAREDDDLYVYTILTIPADFKNTTANLLSPLLINHRTHLGVQVIPVKSRYTTRHPLFPAQKSQLNAVGGGK